MRTGPRVLILSVVLFAAVCAPALAADTLTVFVDNEQVALGAATTIAAHAETDAGYGGGHIAFKYKPASEDCQPAPAADDGIDASGQAAAPVDAGAGVADVGGQMIQLDVGSWRICGWLVDDATGAVVAQSSVVVQVVPYMGSVSIRVKRVKTAFQVTLAYSTSAPGRLYASLQRGGRTCPASPSKMPKRSVLIVPRSGRFIGSDGGLGKSVGIGQLAPGRWRACAWLQTSLGSAGPASRTFSVPRQKRRGGRAAG